jgi:hypothetical protein
MADNDVAERAGGNVPVERLDGAAEPGGGLGGGLEPVWWGLVGFTLLARYRSPAPCFFYEGFAAAESSCRSS